MTAQAEQSEPDRDFATPAPILGVTQSARGQQWQLRPIDDDVVQQHVRTHRISDLLARTLAARGIGVDGAGDFLNPTLRGLFPDPSSFVDMDKAADVLMDTIVRKRPATVFADYDVDGASSGALLVRYFRALGQDLSIYVPDRMAEGYGPSPEAFKHIKDSGSEVIITVDCGAAAYEAMDAAKAMGLTVVVLDHHMMQGEPPTGAAAVVNPNRPDCPSGQGQLTAAGVVYVLLAALNQRARARGLPAPDLMQWLDLPAMGTVCDVAPLLGVNRALVKQGLRIMGRWQNVGLRALAEAAKLKSAPRSMDIGFALGPRINAGGRIGRSDLATRLLSSDDMTEVADLAAQLDALNIERRAIERRALDAAIDLIDRQSNLSDDAPVVVAAGEGWHPGVVGIVAGRLKDRYHRPAICIGIDDSGVGHGSGRSVKGVNLGGAITAAKAAGLLISGGGHAMAAGLKIRREMIPDLRAFLEPYLAAEAAVALANPTLEVDGLAAPASFTPQLADELLGLEPFGPGNPEPVFVVPHARLVDVRHLSGGHIKIAAADEDGRRVAAIAFQAANGPMAEHLQTGAVVHLAGALSRNEWNGRVSAELRLLDVADPRAAGNAS